MDRIKSVKLTTAQWQLIIQALHEEHPKSMFMFRDRMKAKLGFTVRNHLDFVIDTGYTTVVYLDFYSANKRTMFLLKFGEYMTNKQREMDFE